MIQIALVSFALSVVSAFLALGAVSFVPSAVGNILLVVFLGVGLMALLLHLTGAIDKTEEGMTLRKRQDLPPEERRRRM
jgi:hypothetical protein